MFLIPGRWRWNKFAENLLQIPRLRQQDKKRELPCDVNLRRVLSGGLTLGVVQVHSLVEFKLLGVLFICRFVCFAFYIPFYLLQEIMGFIMTFPYVLLCFHFHPFILPLSTGPILPNVTICFLCMCVCSHVREHVIFLSFFLYYLLLFSPYSPASTFLLQTYIEKEGDEGRGESRFYIWSKTYYLSECSLFPLT